MLLLIGTLGTVCFAWGRGHRIPANVLVLGALLAVLATHAVRYQTWFALGVAAAAGACDHARPPRPRRAPRPPKPILIALPECSLAAAVVGSAAFLAATPAHTFDRFVSQPAVEASADYAAAHPDARILADDVTGSAAPLAAPRPRRAGRLRRPHRDLPAIGLPAVRAVPDRLGSSWTAATRGYQELAVTCSLHPNLCAAVKRLDGWRVISRAGGGLVAVRG